MRRDRWRRGRAAFVPVDSTSTALLAALTGAGWMVLSVFVDKPLLKLHFKIAKASLAPANKVRLAQRIDRLTETRYDAVEASASELRRTERDLHDGAQARLVVMGMHPSTIEALIEKDPAQARQLIAVARESSADALTELRDLVRGIHPPVLAERGLGDAVRALVLRLPIETQVDVDLPGRAQAPVESTAYFAVSEILMLRVSVTDNGHGGAAIGSGSGLTGVEHRLGTFDGVLALSSPVGGPTMATLEIPCALEVPCAL